MDGESFAREVGRLVRERRKTLGITQSMFAQMMGVSRRFIISLEMGETPGVRMNTLLRIFEVLGISLALLVEEEDAVAEESKDGHVSLLSKERAKNDKERYSSAFENAVGKLGRPIE